MNGRRKLLAALALMVVLGGCSGGSRGAALSPAPSASAAAHHPASAAVLAADLRAEGLPVRRLIVYTAATDPNHEMGRQGGYTSKVAWVDRRAVKAGAGRPASDAGGTEFGGGIEAFPTAASARARYEYLRGFQAPFGDAYDYLSGTAILR